MIKSKRKEKNLTELQLAEKIGISKSYINKLENHPNKCNPTINLVLNLSEELGLSPYSVFKFLIKDKFKDKKDQE